MFPNRLAFAGLAVACVVAAAGGGYLASRQNVASVASTPAQAAASEPAPVKPVQETEAIVGDTKPAAAPAAASAPTPQQPAAPARAQTAPSSPRATGQGGQGGQGGSSRAPKSGSTSARNAAQQPPVLERSWPSGSTSSQTPGPAAEPAPAPRIDEHPAFEAPRAPEPPAKTFEELVVSSGSVIGLQTETALSSERARVEDRVEAKVVRDVRVGGEVAIPAGTRALGTVVVVERGGKFKERARLGIRFHTLTLADGTRLPISTETIYREGDAPGNGSAAKIGGGAVAGAILGAIIGGGKGAAVGATAGAGAGTATVAAGDRSTATFPAGAEVTARIVAPVTVTIEK
jgi:hypothetical protein